MVLFCLVCYYFVSCKEVQLNQISRATLELNYENEELHDDLSIKKVNLDDLVNKNVESTPRVDVRVISFAKEEAFLQALKQLQKELG